MPAPQQRIDELLRFEPIVFLFLLLAHVSVLFRFEWYPSLDGPAHLYNAHLIKQLLLGNAHLAEHFTFTPFPVPNWSGHAIMVLLSFLFPPNWVEKGLVLIIFAGTAFAFRQLVIALRGSRSWGALLVFPFLCTHTFRMGFFNFSISIAVLLLVLAYWHRIRSEISIARVVKFSLLLGLLYFSNALTLLIALGSIGLWTLIGKWDGGTWKEIRRKMIALVAASAPWLLLTVLFVLRGSEEAAVAYLPKQELWTMIVWGRPFTLQTGVSMVIAARVISVCLVLLAIVLLVYRSKKVAIDRKSDAFLLVIAVLALIAYVVLPDKAATGGIISVRYLLFFFLFLALWIASRPHWPLIGKLLLLPFLLADLWLAYVDHYLTWQLNEAVVEVRSALPHVRDEATVLPILYTDDWLVSNVSNYLGTERGIVVIDNYEAMTTHFPLQWRPQHRAPNDQRSFFNSNRPCIDIDRLGERTGVEFDHVLRWEHSPEITDSCTVDLDGQLNEKFQAEFRSPGGKAELFAR